MNVADLEEFMQPYLVQDNIRKLKFDGIIIAESTSRSFRKERWVEFTLYKTRANLYVVSRIGRSLLFHSKACPTVERNHLTPVDESELPADSIPCQECKPPRISVDGVFPETPRYMAQDSSTAQGVVASVMQYDDNGTRYLTNVARRLLENAAQVDPDIADAFYVDEID